VGLWPFASRDFAFEFRLGSGFLSVVSVVSASGWSLLQRGGVSEYDREASILKKLSVSHRPLKAVVNLSRPPSDLWWQLKSIRTHTGLQQQPARAYHVQTRRLYADCMSDPGIGQQQFRYIDSDSVCSLSVSVRDCDFWWWIQWMGLQKAVKFNEWAYNRQWNFCVYITFSWKTWRCVAKNSECKKDNRYKKMEKYAIFRFPPVLINSCLATWMSSYLGSESSITDSDEVYKCGPFAFR